MKVLKWVNWVMFRIVHCMGSWKESIWVQKWGSWKESNLGAKCEGLERSHFVTFCHISHCEGLERSQFWWKSLSTLCWMLVLPFFLLNIEFCRVQGVTVSWTRAASPVVSWVSISWGQMKAGCLCVVWSSVAGLTSFSLDESCAGGDD